MVAKETRKHKMFLVGLNVAGKMNLILENCCPLKGLLPGLEGHVAALETWTCLGRVIQGQVAAWATAWGWGSGRSVWGFCVRCPERSRRWTADLLVVEAFLKTRDSWVGAWGVPTHLVFIPVPYTMGKLRLRACQAMSV